MVDRAQDYNSRCILDGGGGDGLSQGKRDRECSAPAFPLAGGFDDATVEFYKMPCDGEAQSESAVR